MEKEGMIIDSSGWKTTGSTTTTGSNNITTLSHALQRAPGVFFSHSYYYACGTGTGITAIPENQLELEAMRVVPCDNEL